VRGLGPHRDEGGLDPDRVRAAKVLLWRGHCSVHHRFLPDHVDRVRERIPGVLVHPECRREVVAKADEVGSTERTIKVVAASPPGSAWAIGTELNLVHRLASEHPDKTIAFLDRTVCFCSTMNRIDLPHLTWALEELVAGRVPNRVRVDEATRADALVALERMLALPG
jgi:quinolinate synthase